MEQEQKQTQLLLSDIERNKELFEYEMTEVLLQLKGSFSKMNSQNMQCSFAETEVKKPDLNITLIAPETQEIVLKQEVSVRKSDAYSPVSDIPVSGFAGTVPRVSEVADVKATEIHVSGESFRNSIYDKVSVDSTKSALSGDGAERHFVVPEIREPSPAKLERNAFSMEVPHVKKKKYSNIDSVTIQLPEGDKIFQGKTVIGEYHPEQISVSDTTLSVEHAQKPKAFLPVSPERAELRMAIVLPPDMDGSNPEKWPELSGLAGIDELKVNYQKVNPVSIPSQNVTGYKPSFDNVQEIHKTEFRNVRGGISENLMGRLHTVAGKQKPATEADIKDILAAVSSEIADQTSKKAV